MDCQQLVTYGLILLVGLYVLKDVFGFKLEPMTVNAHEGGVSSDNMVFASESNNNEKPLSVKGLSTDKTSCYPQNTLTPDDLLPKDNKKQIQDFNNNYPEGEGILKGVNFLDAGFHVGVNTIGQSLRNANLNLRAEPANPQVKVSPWMNTSIAPDLSRKSLNDDNVCNVNAP